jgi:anti-anti-sigma regulatory factor
MSPLFFSKLKAESIETKCVNGFHVFKIREDLALGADFGSIIALVENAVRKGNVNIAIQFTHRSFLYTPTILRLAQIYKTLQTNGGTLCLIQPNEDILAMLDKIGLTKIIRVVQSENEL